MKKIIILSRVSTGVQNIESQTNELIKEAIRLGYSESQQIVIENVESAIKLKEEERQGLIKLKSTIEKDPEVDCVICWEPSRLSRQQTTLYNIRDYLFERKIQLYIMQPYVKLLTDDRQKIDTTASIVFSLFATISENEMMLKKERFRRAKKNLKLQGKKFTGLTTFGYMVDKEKNCVPHPIHSKIVVELFDYYVNNKDVSLYETYKYATSKYPELFPVIEYRKAQHKMQHLLHFATYAYGNELYKPIISVEVFEKSLQKMKKAKNVSRYSTKVEFLGRGKVRCKECGNLMTPASGSTMGYICLTDSLHNCQINCEALDWLIWEETRVAINIAASIDNSSKVIQMNSQIEDKKNLGEKTKEYITGLREKQDKLVSLYLDDKINKSTYEKKYEELSAEITEEESDYNALLRQINELEVTLSNSGDMDISSVNVDNITEFKTKLQYVREYVENVWVEKQDKIRKISFDWKKNLVGPRSTYLYTGWGGYKKIWRVNEDGTKDYIYCMRSSRPPKDIDIAD